MATGEAARADRVLAAALRSLAKLVEGADAGDPDPAVAGMTIQGTEA